MTGTSGRSGVQSVAIAARILKILAEQGGELPLKDLAAATGMPRAKVHRYLASLRGAGLVAQDAETGLYRIGSTAVMVGLVGLGRLSPVRQLQDMLPRLRDQIGETVTAAIWGDMGPTIIAIEESDHLVTMNLRIGSVLPLSGTAIGRVFLAYMPAAMTKRLVTAERRGPASARPSQRQLAEIIADIRHRRLSRAHGVLLPGVDALAAPVFDYRGDLVAVICAVGHTDVMSTRWDGPVAKALDAATRELSRRLGFVDGQPGQRNR